MPIPKCATYYRWIRGLCESAIINFDLISDQYFLQTGFVHYYIFQTLVCEDFHLNGNYVEADVETNISAPSDMIRFSFKVNYSDASKKSKYPKHQSLIRHLQFACVPFIKN